MNGTNSKKTKPFGVEFVLAPTAAMGAVLFTNPIDVVKVRMQLQGELKARGTYKIIYKNAFHAAYAIAKYDGIMALQSGIKSALAFQFFLNGMRIGTYKLCREYGLANNEDGTTNIVKTAVFSGTGGVIGSILGSPFYMVKTQMQSQSIETALAVGHQHHHTSEWAAYKTLWRQGGFGALYQQWYANGPRVFCGSAVQMTTFGLVSDWLRNYRTFNDHPLLLTFCAALMGGTSIALTTQPFDLVSIRLYNQGNEQFVYLCGVLNPKLKRKIIHFVLSWNSGTDAKGRGLVYRNFFDAIVKIFKKEGIYGLYKGTFPTWLRIGPHSVLCLCFYEQLDRLYESVIN